MNKDIIDKQINKWNVKEEISINYENIQKINIMEMIILLNI